MAKELHTDIQKGIDDSIDALRWARHHLDERSTAETIRLIQHNLGCLALAIDWQMEGQDYKVAEVLMRLWWNPHRKDRESFDMNPTSH